MAEGTFRIDLDTPRGRVLVSDSLSYCDERVTTRDVVVGASFAGIPTVALALERGARGIIAHAAGVGLDGAGVAGLELSDEHGTPAAAIETMSARISDGESLYKGVVSHANRAATDLGVEVGMCCREAARAMLHGPEGNFRSLGSVVDSTLRAVASHRGFTVYAIWSLMLVRGPDRDGVYCAASHAGKVMGDYALKVMPKAVFANDAGGCMDGSGYDGLPVLDKAGIPAVAVAAQTARIGDALSTYRDGVCAVVNKAARGAGVVEGMTVVEAARVLATY